MSGWPVDHASLVAMIVTVLCFIYSLISYRRVRRMDDEIRRLHGLPQRRGSTELPSRLP